MNWQKYRTYISLMLGVLVLGNLFVLSSYSIKNASSIYLNGVTKSEILKALTAANKLQNQYNKPMQTQQLTSEQKNKLLKQLLGTLATKEALSGSDNMLIKNQQHGKIVTVDMVKMREPGFISITDSEESKMLGSSRFLSKGMHKKIKVHLKEYVDGINLTAYLYKDDGDRSFDMQKDEPMKDDTNWSIYKSFDVNSRRNLNYCYYSNNLKYGPALLLREQLPGNKIKFQSISTPSDAGSSEEPFFIAIFKDNNGLPGKIIGYSRRTYRGGKKFRLTEPVSNEMLYAMIFKDDGDGKFNPALDTIVRGENNLVIIVKFKVIK